MAIERIDYRLCDDCGICYDICPLDVFGIIDIYRTRERKSLVYVKYPDDCMCCYLCEIDCHVDAIYVSPTRAFEVCLPY